MGKYEKGIKFRDSGVPNLNLVFNPYFWNIVIKWNQQNACWRYFTAERTQLYRMEHTVAVKQAFVGICRHISHASLFYSY